MRKLIYHIACSIDGYIAHEDGSVDGLLMAGEHADDFVASLQRYDTVIMGTNTYAFGFQFGLQPGAPAYEGLRHLIVTRSLEFEESEAVQRITTDVVHTIQDEKERPGKEIWLCGGGHLAGHLMQHNLIDEICLKVNPVLFGKGIGLLGGQARLQPCQLKEKKAYKNGVMLQEYSIT
ncbi:MAG: dihydrofolate reductase family protein [Chloroflexota bacterium]